ncbi:MAG: S-layer homology domain-containing protein [Desulfotomaculaceae bacterium]|nr:S-layer homology domain-containing protein [Desulfotomaculaceae bacterium]
MIFNRKVIVIICLATLLFYSSAMSAYASIVDIRGHWAEHEISDWVNRGFVIGYPDGKFRPDKNITRAEFITLVNKAFGFYDKAKVNFKDVSSANWFYNEVAAAVAAGYIRGYVDNTIRPDQPITRQEVAAIAYRLLGRPAATGSNTLSKFRDAASISSWSEPGVVAVVEKNVMKGYHDQTFRPRALTTRAEAVVTMSRAFWLKYPVIIS